MTIWPTQVGTLVMWKGRVLESTQRPGGKINSWRPTRKEMEMENRK